MSAGPIAWRARMQSRNPGAKRSIWLSMRAVMSAVDPLGTWQYAQSVCLPAGARDGSQTVGCTSST